MRAKGQHQSFRMRTAWIISLFQLSCLAITPAPTLDVVQVNLSASFAPDDIKNKVISVENRTRTLGLQDALSGRSFSTDGAITLFVNACEQDDGTRNCTAACQNQTQMFSNLQTLHNCAVFPQVSIALANSTVSDDARRLAADLRIEPNNNNLTVPLKIMNSIQQCLFDSCDGDSRCTSHIKPVNFTSEQSSLDKLSRTLNQNSHSLCTTSPAFVDSDVGGIGVCSKLPLSSGMLTSSLGVYLLHHANGACFARIPCHYPVGLNREKVTHRFKLLP